MPLRPLLATKSDTAPMLARLVLGLVMIPHGLQHALGLLGGYGFSGTLAWMTGTLGFPRALAALAITVELLAPFALVVGFAGRLAAAGIAGLMIGALTTHWPNGFFMNWFGKLPPGSEGFEYHLLALTLAAIVVVAGSGALSLDAVLGTPRHDDMAWRMPVFSSASGVENRAPLTRSGA